MRNVHVLFLGLSFGVSDLGSQERRVGFVTVRDLEQDQRRVSTEDLIASEVSSSLQLEDVSVLDVSEIRITDGGSEELALRTNNAFQLVGLLQFRLANQGIEFNQFNVNEVLGQIRDPGQLVLGRAEVTARIGDGLDVSDNAIAILGDLLEDNVTPVHKSQLRNVLDPRVHNEKKYFLFATQTILKLLHSIIIEY